jgi:hypothetical protein
LETTCPLQNGNYFALEIHPQTMASNQNNNTPSGQSISSFVSAVQAAEETRNASSVQPSPNEPRILFEGHGPMLPGYMAQYIDNRARTIDLSAVAEEARDYGAAESDSVGSAPEANDFTDALVESMEDRNTNADDGAPFTDENAIRGLTSNANTPKPPADFVVPGPKPNSDEAAFEDDYNPGDWHPYGFKPCYGEGTGKVHSYSLPTKAEPCPLQNGCMKSNGWVFYYKNWKIVDSWKTDGPFSDIIQGKSLCRLIAVELIFIQICFHLRGRGSSTMKY